MYVFFPACQWRHDGILFCWKRSTASPRSIYASGGVRPEAWIDARNFCLNLVESAAVVNQ